MKGIAGGVNVTINMIKIHYIYTKNFHEKLNIM